MNEAVQTPRVTAATKLIGIDKVQDRLDIKKTTVYEWIKLGVLPFPCKVGNTNRWPENEIDALVERLMSARPASRSTPASS